jgi:3-oxoacyl-(acyl-carrier-protein) synthase
MCVLAMQSGFTPANLGWSEAQEGVIIPTRGREGVDLRNVICNSFGFGGNDSSMVLSKEPKTAGVPSAEEYEVKVASDVEITSTESLSELREFISPMESRRMGKLMKAAHLSSLRALQQAGIECPDAIVTATARGMLETSMQFLDDMLVNGEELLKPTLFMQSTHNTLSSAIAIRAKCHGYNTTYSQGEESLQWAMRDAERLIATGKTASVLVGLYDESTPTFSELAERSGRERPQDLYARSIVLVRK